MLIETITGLPASRSRRTARAMVSDATAEPPPESIRSRTASHRIVVGDVVERPGQIVGRDLGPERAVAAADQARRRGPAPRSRAGRAGVAELLGVASSGAGDRTGAGAAQRESMQLVA